MEKSTHHEYNDVNPTSTTSTTTIPTINNHRNNYSLANTNGLVLIKDLLFYLMEMTGQVCGSFYDSFTLDAPQCVKRNIDKTLEKDGNIGKLYELLTSLIKQQSYLFKSNSISNSTSSIDLSNTNSNTTTTTNGGEYISSSSSFESTPTTSSVYSSPTTSSVSSSSTSTSSTPSTFQINNDSLTPDQMKIKQLELELLKIKEATALFMMNKAALSNANNNNNNNNNTPIAPAPKAAAPPPPPPPPPPPQVFKQPSFLLKKNSAALQNSNNSTNSSSNSNGATTAAPPAPFNFADVLLKRPLLKKVNNDRSPGGTPAKESKPKGGVEDALLKAIVSKFKHANSPIKSHPSDDESSDSDFE